jgi:hypothetical protein
LKADSNGGRNAGSGAHRLDFGAAPAEDGRLEGVMLPVLVLVGCGDAEPPPPPPPPPVAPTERPDRKQSSLGMKCDAEQMAAAVAASADAAAAGPLTGSDALCNGRFGRVVVAGPDNAKAVALMKFEAGSWRVLGYGPSADAQSCADKTTLPAEVCQELAAVPQ